MLLLALAVRSGLAMRRGRLARARRTPDMRARHLRFAKPAVVMLLVGAVAGPFSWVYLRGGSPFETFHGWVGLAAASLLAATGWLGRKLERGTSRAFDIHALLGGLAVLIAALAAMAGMAILP